MINYKLDTVNPVNSLMKGVNNGLAIRAANTSNKRQEQAIKATEDNQNYLNQTVRPREEALYNQGQEDRNELKNNQKIQTQAQQITSILSHTPSKEARTAIFDDLKKNNPSVLPYVDEGYSKIQKQQIEAIDLAMKEGKRHAFAVMNMTLDQVPNYVKNITAKFPEIASQLPLNVRTEEDLNTLKKAVAVMQLKDEKQAEYLLKGLTGDTGEERKGALTDYQKINLISDLREQWGQDPSAVGQEAEWKLFGANQEAIPSQDFIDWVQAKRPEEYNMIYGGQSAKPQSAKPQTVTPKKSSAPKTNDSPEVLNEIQDLLNLGGELSYEEAAPTADGSIQQPNMLVINDSQQPVVQSDTKTQVAKVADSAMKTGDATIQQVVAKASELVDKGANSAELAEVEKDFNNVMGNVSAASGSLSDELKTVWAGVVEDWNKLMLQIKSGKQQKNALMGR